MDDPRTLPGLAVHSEAIACKMQIGIVKWRRTARGIIIIVIMKNDEINNNLIILISMQKRIENMHLFLIAGNTLPFVNTNQLSHRHYMV